ncbi:MAG TPA: fatty acid--CoA ligase family protein [Acidimicrobiales bacterium]|jgi:O-succinylbenzoic acid--CoA ligase|nr:fatty acid--CoA ligase family protein [Acidimicrobiales bacterium]
MPTLVALDLPGGPPFVAELQRVWDAGDAALPVDPRLPPTARRQVFGALAPGAVVDADGRRSIDGGRPVEPGDALVVATSGTTGLARGVVLTHAAVQASAAATSARLEVDPAVHCWLACLPLSHVGGLSVVTRAVLTGAGLVVHPGFDATAVMAAAGPEVLISLVPTTLRRVDAGAFRTVVLGGSAPPEELPANVVTTYGMTETGSGVVYDGLPLAGVEVAIGAAQEIRLRGPMLLRAYRDGTVPLDADGWLNTGDAGYVDAGRRLHVNGRLSDLIISGGENVWPATVEAALRDHPGVKEVAVAGRPDPEWGERVVAWVVPVDRGAPPTLDELRGAVKARLGPWAAPRQLVLADGLPKTAIGKIRRDALPA